MISCKPFLFLASILTTSFALTATKSFAWSLKPPKTGIGIIDNNRDVIGGATAGSIVGGATGAFAGAWWGDHKQAQDKINELRQNNNQLAADLAQAKLDNETQRAELEGRIKNQVESNACLKNNDNAYRLILSVISEAKDTFNSCLEKAAADTEAQACLNTYDARVNTMLDVGLAASGCN